ncbi:hypothetical protein G9A89_020604 [Geosiphon pyriformis]|nr:hypothetical protein G9A89_020604 [Geosiphon pyriformis]
MPDLWFQQYMLLDYIDSNAFSGVMNEIGMEELSLVVDNLPNDKTAGLIALVNTACKILSKILSDQISLACNKFNVLCGNNFLVLKGTSTQSPIFAIGLVVENALEKNREFWLVLQNMYKAYNSVDWHHLQVKTIAAIGKNMLSVLDSDRFLDVRDNLLEVWSDWIEIYTDGSLRCAGSVEMAGGAAAYFLAADTAVVLALECVLSLCSVVLYLDSQFAIDACISKASIERLHIDNLLESKNISIRWVKVKSYLDVLGNIRADALANEKKFLVTEETAISGNVCHFTGPGFDIILNTMIKKIDWGATAIIWHLNSHMLSGFTSRKLANLHTYLIKTVYRQLSVVVRKRLYNKSYPGVLYLLYNKMELSDHVFTCFGNFGLHGNILFEAAKKWMSMSGLMSSSTSAVLHLLLLCSSNIGLYMAVCKSFVMRNWYVKAVLVFEGQKKTALALTIRTKYKVNIEKTGLVGDNSLISVLSDCVVFRLLAGTVCMLGVIESGLIDANCVIFSLVRW